MKEISIQNVKILQTCALSPMASVADRAYRDICRKFGASFLTSEMVSAKGLCYSGTGSIELCSVHENQRPYAIQLFGEEPEFIFRAVKIVNNFQPDIIDLNMGCPVAKVVNPGGGSALMKNPELAAEITKAAVAAAGCPVTVKIRAGWDDSHINAPEFAQLMEKSGASAIAIHPRTRAQMYSGRADWSIIKQVKDAVSVPVIGNGDIKSGADAKKMYLETGCDLVSVARGSNGRPWIFEQISHFLETGEELPEPSLERRMEIMLHHVDRLIEYKGEVQGVREARKNVAWYLKGVRGAAVYRNESGSLSTRDDILRLVDTVLRNNND